VSAKVPYRARAVGGRVAQARSTHALTASESAWLVALPCALATVLAIVVLGPPLGDALFSPPRDATFWPYEIAVRGIHPEPTEHGRFVIALLGPLLAAGCALALRGRDVDRRRARIGSLAAQGVLLAFVVACVAYQRSFVYGPLFGRVRVQYFTLQTLLAALAAAVLLAYALRRRASFGALAALARETTARRVTAAVVAALFAVAFLLTAFNSDGTIYHVHTGIWIHVSFITDEAFAVLEGHPPLVDFHAQYGHLWAYVAAAGMALFGTSLGVYSTVMLLGAGGALAAIYATLRRLTRSSAATVALFLPFVATSAYMKSGPPEDRYTALSLFTAFPVRYFGPYVLLWLLVRRVDRGTRKTAIPLFAAAGLTVINNPEFGLPAFAATALALVASARRQQSTADALRRAAVDAAAGAALAALTTCVLTLAVGGSLPHFGMLLTFPRIFGSSGFAMLPMPALGLHLVVYVTFSAALVAGIARTGRDDPALAAALTWVGAFGLGAGAYFAGRSHPEVLIDMFSIWALALVLLTIVAVRGIAASDRRLPSPAALLVLVGFGVLLCSLAQTPAPWSQIARLRDVDPVEEQVIPLLNEAVASLTRPGEPVALLILLGHRTAYEIGIDNVTPYANAGSMPTQQQWEEMLDALDRAHGRRIVAPLAIVDRRQAAWLRERGFHAGRKVPQAGIFELVRAPVSRR
jgi:hypothetical protein